MLGSWSMLNSKMTIPTINYGSITKQYMIFNHSLENEKTKCNKIYTKVMLSYKVNHG